MLVVLGITSAAALQFGITLERRQAEDELLFIGGEFSRALTSYRAATPIGHFKRDPVSLDQLLNDTRYPVPRRHLRRLYVDPLTGNDQWGLGLNPDGTIASVFSHAEGTPAKQSGFPAQWGHFAEAKSYADWQFSVPLHATATPLGGANSSQQGLAPWLTHAPGPSGVPGAGLPSPGGGPASTGPMPGGMPGPGSGPSGPGTFLPGH